MNPQTLIAFPNYMAALGGALVVRIGVRKSSVELAKGIVIKLPTKALGADLSKTNSFGFARLALAWKSANGEVWQA